MRHSEETKRKISQSLKGNIPWMKGRHHSLAALKKMSLAKKGKASPWKGKAPSEQTRLLMKRKAVLKWQNVDYRRMMTEKHKGPRLDIRGRNHPNWRGGITPVDKKIRHSLEYRNWRTAGFIRDDFTCKKCEKRGGKLNFDHFPVPFKAILTEVILLHGMDNLVENSLPYNKFWDINNGRTLCVDCHRETDTYGFKSRRIV